MALGIEPQPRPGEECGPGNAATAPSVNKNTLGAVVCKSAMLTAERLRDLLWYDQETGVFVWRTRRHNVKTYAGARAGTVANGYRLIGIDGVKHRSARLAVLYVTGKMPGQLVDHINGDKLDDRFQNLREASPSVNRQNLRSATSASKTGTLGVAPYRGRYQASIGIGGLVVRLGVFDTVGQAGAAYVEAKRLMHEGCTL